MSGRVPMLQEDLWRGTTGGALSDWFQLNQEPPILMIRVRPLNDEGTSVNISQSFYPPPVEMYLVEYIPYPLSCINHFFPVSYISRIHKPALRKSALTRPLCSLSCGAGCAFLPQRRTCLYVA